jgi:hypothetical protein
MVTQKRAPGLAWWPASLHHVLGDAGLRDLKPELEKLAVDARRAPKRVLDYVVPNPVDLTSRLSFWRNQVRDSTKPPGVTR